MTGLLALMCLTERGGRRGCHRSGELVTLDEQDRGAWDRALSPRVRAWCASGCGRGGRRRAAGRYQLLAAINAVHTAAPSPATPTGQRSSASTTRLVRIDPSPVVRLNRAVAVAELDGPAVGAGRGRPARRRSTATTRSTSLGPSCYAGSGGAGRRGAAYDRAIELTGNPAERAYLARRRDQLGP